MSTARRCECSKKYEMSNEVAKVGARALAGVGDGLGGADALAARVALRVARGHGCNLHICAGSVTVWEVLN